MSSKPSIAHVIDTLQIGGKERIAVLLANELFKKGYEVKLVLIHQTGPMQNELNDGISVQVINRLYKWRLGYLKKLYKCLRSASIIHVHAKHDLRYVLLCKLLFGLKAKIILQDHSHKVYFTWKDHLLTFARHQFIYVGVTQQHRQAAQNVLHIPKSKAYFVPHAFALSTISKRYKKTEQTLQFVAVARLINRKNILFLIDLLKEFNNIGGAELTIYGTKEDLDYLQQINTKIKYSNLQNKVTIILNKAQQHIDLTQYDMALHAAVQESGPLVLMEFLGAGIPFLSYQTGAIADMLSKDFPECIMEHFDVAAWAKQIEFIQSNKIALKQRIEKLLDGKYSVEKYVQRWERIYGVISSSCA